MRQITPRLTPEIANHCKGEPVWRATPFRIPTFRELVVHAARLAFANSDELLFFRGQDKDYQSKAGGSTLYPGIYRGDHLPQRELRHRFDVLDQACRLLVQSFRAAGIEGHKDVERKRYIQWSILQHYEVVQTPLIDLTQSLRVACSFAQLASTNPECYVYIFGLPYLANRISMNSEHDLVNVRLLSICPPTALRPYFQEGYLAGTSDITLEFDTKTELDFRNRLVAKFAIPRAKKFWGEGFEPLPPSALYPPGDSIKELCDQLREDLRPEMVPGDLGTFVENWASLEQYMLEEARRLSERNVSVRESIGILNKRGVIDAEAAAQIDFLRRLRNIIVHTPEKVPQSQISAATERVRSILRSLTEQA
jgi:hypothetical protein